MSSDGEDKTRLVLMLSVVLWASALAAIFVGMRLRNRPILIVGALDAGLAALVTVLAASGRRRR